MRHLGFLITIFGLFGLLSAAPGRVKRQTNMNLMEKCQAIFHVACDALATIGTGTKRPIQARDNIPTPETPNCECVRFYQCSKNGTMTTDGSGILDKRMFLCPGLHDVCCKAASIVLSDDSAVLYPQ